MLSSPYLIGFVSVAIIIFLCIIIAGIIKFVLRFFFKKIKFIFCLALVILAIILFSGTVAMKPFQNISKESGTGVMQQATEQFKGFYSDKLPLLAWRFTQLNNDNADTASGETVPNKNSEPVFIRVDYLPVGEIVLQYNTETKKFSVVEGLNITEKQNILSTFTGKLGNLLRSILPNTGY